MNSVNADFLQWFRDVSPYIHAHRNKTFVVMIPGECLEQPDFVNIVSDISILHALGIRIVVVHGARRQIDEELAGAGIVSTFHKGSRITEREHLSHLLRAVGIARWRLEALFSSGLPNSPMYGAKLKIRSGNFIAAMPQGVIDGIDFQMTGTVRNVDAKAIGRILDDACIVVLSPIGYSITGEVFNLSFADIGISVAGALAADKIIVYNDDGAIYDKNGTLFRQLTLDQCRRFLEREMHHAPSNSYFSLRAGYAACRQGVPRAHIISSAEDGTLLQELFTREGTGTMIYSDSYESLRPARLEDVAGILNIIGPLEEEGVLVKRSRELLESEIDCFTVLERDGLVIGCAALYPFKDAPAGELACLAVLKEYRKGGRAHNLLEHVELRAKELGLQEVYTLTTQTSHWFIEQGFVESSVDVLPASRQALYNYQRNSKVLVKRLG